MFPFPAAKLQPHASGMLERGMKTFAMPKRQEVHNILDDRQGSFSKLAYNHLGQNTVIRQRLQGELAQATILGESQRKIMQRVRRVTGQSIYQAKRVAQTERNRVQSQARWDAAQQAEQQGVRTYNEWRCRFVNSREAHMNRHGKRVMQGQTFPDSVMRYPGDPNGSAKEVINCHCYLQVGVLLHDETLDSEGKVVKLEQAPAAEDKQEKERVTKSKDYAVDSKLLQSRTYAEKFDRMTDDPQERREFLKAAKEILQHRSGQNGEDLYLYNRSTGQWTKSTSGRDAGTPEYTQDIRSAIKKAKQGELVAFHNHPASMPPSDGDLNAAKRNGYSVGYVLCHDGKIFRYTAPRKEIISYYYSAEVEKRKQNGYNEYEAQLKALKSLSETYSFTFEEV